MNGKQNKGKALLLNIVTSGIFCTIRSLISPSGVKRFSFVKSTALRATILIVLKYSSTDKWSFGGPGTTCTQERSEEPGQFFLPFQHFSFPHSEHTCWK